MKRILLFVMTNLAVVAVLGVVASLLASALTYEIEAGHSLLVRVRVCACVLAGGGAGGGASCGQGFAAHAAPRVIASCPGCDA